MRWSTAGALARWALGAERTTAERGLVGEELAARALAAGGLRLLGRRLACGPAEVDLVGVEADGTLVVVEVKTGRAPESGVLRHRPAAHLGAAQAARLGRAARALAAARRAPGWRVELVEVLLRQRGADVAEPALVSKAARRPG